MNAIRRLIVTTLTASAIALPLAAFAAPVYLYSGSTVTSKINQTIDSGTAHAGDRFTMTLVSPYPRNNSAFSNGQLYGHVTRVVRAGQGQNAALEFAVDRLVLPGGRQAHVNMMLQSQETQKHNNVGNIAMTAAAGMILGNMVGKTLFGSKLGGPAGAIAGALYANNKRTNVSLRQGSVVVTEARQTVALTYPTGTAYRH
ncbi:MAG: hypothetical protein DLM53_10075 [Candidatus Eremiobacter antarcticus]|nr:hypothetical protein [Candidatus Eremiobacteraeota bacterium]MBC5807185.1 hypothetical protein [Candidatus Eremiobacteraeota bacterium]PZR60990.1 MAG: hypothetical protein DLM53_10075 [Candidatus Eremiobacter sp. RRmetagenome_bin22]